MKKILDMPLSYYRISLGGGNLIYFSHELNIAESEYIDLTIKDVIKKIDDLVEAYDSLVTINNALQAAINPLIVEVKSLNEKLISQGDTIVNLSAKIDILENTLSREGEETT